MVTLHRMEPGLIQPVQCRLALWAAVHQVADAEQPVHSWIEADGLQLCLQSLEMTVNIAHGIIAPPRVDGKSFNPTHGALP
ncbi:hypothetical protein D3C77_740530 [compost metagenome]